MSESLVADVTSTRQAWTGFGLADGIEDVTTAIKSEGWVDDALAGGGLALEAVGTVLDPFSSLLASGLSWAMEYFEPLREMLDSLTGNPDAVAAHVSTWNNMAGALMSTAEDLQGHLTRDLPTWVGDASDSYQAMMSNNVEGIGGLAATAGALGAATEGAINLVSLVRELVRDLIADLVARVIVWAVEAIFVVTIPVIAAQIAAAVVKWAGRIMSYTSALITSLTSLKKLLGV
jgi:uncharacterized protein YukE